jgi:hypothetical protein
MAPAERCTTFLCDGVLLVEPPRLRPKLPCSPQKTTNLAPLSLILTVSVTLRTICAVPRRPSDSPCRWVWMAIRFASRACWGVTVNAGYQSSGVWMRMSASVMGSWILITFQGAAWAA